jgi:hypothetical protein
VANLSEHLKWAYKGHLQTVCSSINSKSLKEALQMPEKLLLSEGT